MKPFRIFLFTSVITLGVFSATLYSCSKSDSGCNGTVCVNADCVDGKCVCHDGWGGANCTQVKCGSLLCDPGKICVNGACACPTGYEGVNCATLVVSKLIGNWTVQEQGTISSAAQYTISITENKNVALQVRISNIRNNFAAPVIATVKGDSILIPSQVVSSQTVVGKGIFTSISTGHQITMWYKVTDVANDTDDFGYDSGAPSVWHMQ